MIHSGSGACWPRSGTVSAAGYWRATPTGMSRLPNWAAVTSNLVTLLAESDVATLPCPLTPETYHLIDAAAVAQMKPGVMPSNTSRGALLDTPARAWGCFAAFGTSRVKM